MSTRLFVADALDWCRSIDDRDTGTCSLFREEPTARAHRWSANPVGAGRRSGIAVTLHELATNAAKYGALSAADGQVDLKWSHEADGRLQLRWTETGGPNSAGTYAKGFWETYHRTNDRQQKGKARFDWRTEGLVCEITLQVK